MVTGSVMAVAFTVAGGLGFATLRDFTEVRLGAPLALAGDFAVVVFFVFVVRLVFFAADFGVLEPAAFPGLAADLRALSVDA